MKTYTGSWSANNGTSYNTGYTDTNKKRLTSCLKRICKGNIFAGNTGRWSIVDHNGLEIKEGFIRN